MNLTTTLLQDIPTFDGQDITKLEDWPSDVEIAVDILNESHACLADAKSCSPMHTLVCEALQAWKSWGNLLDILHLKLCNVNIHIHTSCFMEIQQMDNETLAACVHCFKMEAKRCDFNSDTGAICIFVKGLWDTHNIAAKVYEKDPRTLLEVTKLMEKLNTESQVTATLSSPTVNMMLNDKIICGRKGHIGHHCPDAQCYKCDSFGHFAQDCPEKIHPSGTPNHPDRMHSHSSHNCSCRHRSHCFHHRYSQGNCFNRSGSHH